MEVKIADNYQIQPLIKFIRQLTNPMYNDILAYLPYKSSFLFIDNISSLDMDGVTGDYTLRKDAFFYKDHFINNPCHAVLTNFQICIKIGNTHKESLVAIWLTADQLCIDIRKSVRLSRRATAR